MKKNSFHSVLNLFSKIILLFLTIFFLNDSAFAQYKRNVVFEEFSEVWCGPCASVAPSITKWLENHPDYIPIVYYSYFVDNGKQVFNSKEDYNQRNNFYDVPFFPYARINAELAPNTSWPGYPTDTSKINSIIDTMSKTTPVNVAIDFINNGATGTINVEITSDIALDNKNLFVFLVEKYHHYQKQSNGLEEFHHIFRDLLPTTNGQEFSITAGGTINFSFDYTLDNNINFDLYATAIIQDAQIKHIYQSESVFKPSPNSIEDNIELSNKIQVLPNPVINDISIILNSDIETIKNVEVFDILGNNIISLQVNSDINKMTLSGMNALGNKLPNGIYFLQVKAEKHFYFNKFIVLNN